LEYVGAPVYVDQDTPDTARYERLKNPYLYQFLQENGYVLNIADAWDFLDKSNTEYSYKSEYLYKKETLEYHIFHNSAFYPFYGYTNTETEIENLHNVFDYIQYSSKIRPDNLFTIGYFMTPHTPFFVDENGNLLDTTERTHFTDSNYLGQLKYISEKILKTVKKLLLLDSDCIIMLMSDHGYRKPHHLNQLGSGILDFDRETYFMTNTLNVVYYRGEKIDIEGLSNMNTLITVLNELSILNMPLVEYPDYAEFINDYKERGLTRDE
jgi:hypothetical protein